MALSTSCKLFLERRATIRLWKNNVPTNLFQVPHSQLLENFTSQQKIQLVFSNLCKIILVTYLRQRCIHEFLPCGNRLCGTMYYVIVPKSVIIQKYSQIFYFSDSKFNLRPYLKVISISLIVVSISRSQVSTCLVSSLNHSILICNVFCSILLNFLHKWVYFFQIW